jgi:hypothetical protein
MFNSHNSLFRSPNFIIPEQRKLAEKYVFFEVTEPCRCLRLTGPDHVDAPVVEESDSFSYESTRSPDDIRRELDAEQRQVDEDGQMLLTYVLELTEQRSNRIKAKLAICELQEKLSEQKGEMEVPIREEMRVLRFAMSVSAARIGDISRNIAQILRISPDDYDVL